MYIQFTSNKLASILSDLRSVITQKTSFPALSNVLIESTTAGKVLFTATDLDHTLRIEVAHDGLFTGKFCVGLDRLLGLAKALPEADLTLKPQDNGRVEVQSDSGVYKVAGIPVDGFPAVEEGEAQSYELQAADFLRALSTVAPHMGNEEDKRFEMRGVLFELNGSLKCVATDGASMGVCEVTPVQPFLTGQALVSWVLTRKTVRAIQAAFEPASTIICWGTDNLLSFRQGDRRLTSRRPDQKFPAYDMVLRSLSDNPVDFDRDGLLRALDVMASFKPTSRGHIGSYKRAAFAVGPDGLTVTSAAPNGEEAVEEVDGKSSKPFEALVDVQMLRQMLKTAGEGASLCAEAGKPWTLVSEAERVKTTQLIMPLNR